MAGSVCRLQTGRHFASMHRITPRIRVARDEENRRIRHPVFDTVVRGVGYKRAEILLIFGRSVLVAPPRRKIEEMISCHVEKRPKTNGRPEEIWALGNCRPDKQASIGTAADCNTTFDRKTLCHKPFSSGYKVIKGGLAFFTRPARCHSSPSSEPPRNAGTANKNPCSMRKVAKAVN